jgi:hypothetical protein
MPFYVNARFMLAQKSAWLNILSEV